MQQMALTDIYKLVLPNTKESSSIQKPMESFLKINHILGHKNKPFEFVKNSAKLKHLHVPCQITEQ